jgi:hypothetical protein
MTPAPAFKKTENGCSFIGMSALEENKWLPILGEIGSSNFLAPIKNESSGFMNLARFLIMIQ